MTNPEPHVDERPAIPFIGTTTGVTTTTFAEIADRIPGLVGGLISHGITPMGAPFFRYLDLRGESMTVQVGVPVPAGAELAAGTVPFETESGTLPAGRYACSTHLGPFEGLREATQQLLRWADQQGLRFDMDTVDGVQRWACRLEIYLTDPRIETDPNRFQTELAFRLAD